LLRFRTAGADPCKAYLRRRTDGDWKSQQRCKACLRRLGQPT